MARSGPGGPRRAGGFSLLELMLAMSLLALGLLVLAGMQLQAMRGGSSSRRASEAAAIAQVRMESLQRVEALKQTHPDYEANVDKWMKYLDLYMSQDIYRFIHKHIREDTSRWEQRVARGYYYNYVKAVVDLFSAFLFHAPIDRDPSDDVDLFKEIYKNSDLAGTMWNVFLQNACTFAQVEGHVGILVDAPQSPPGGFASEEERKAANARPYLVMFHAHQIVDWEIDRYGNFQWVKLKVFRPMDREWTTSSSRKSDFYQIWTKETWEEWEVTKAEGEEQAIPRGGGTHGLGQVPLVIVRVDKHPTHTWFGQSSVKDIADINIAILNWASLGDEEIFERCLNILAMERGEGDAPTELSHANVLEYEPGTNTPAYLSPGDTPLKLISEWIEKGSNEIRRLAKLNISTGLGDVRQASSGIAKAFSFLETNQSLASKALGLEQTETKLHQIISRWMTSSFQGSIQYPREFGVEDFLTLFQEMDMARGSFTSETAIKEMEKMLVRKRFASADMKLRKKMEAEIDKAETTSPNVPGAFGMIPPGMKLSDLIPGSKEEEDDAKSSSEESPPNRPDDGKATGANPGNATAA